MTKIRPHAANRELSDVRCQKMILPTRKNTSNKRLRV